MPTRGKQVGIFDLLCDLFYAAGYLGVRKAPGEEPPRTSRSGGEKVQPGHPRDSKRGNSEPTSVTTAGHALTLL